MKDSIRSKLENLQERFEEVSALLSEPDVIGNQNKFRELSMEYAHLEPVVNSFSQYRKANNDLATATDMLKDSDPELRAMAEDEYHSIKTRIEELELELQKLLLPKDPHDNSNIFLEIRAGTGGDEAAIFAGDLFRMYCRYAENNHWQIEILNDD